MSSYTNVLPKQLYFLKELGFWEEKVKTKYELVRLRSKNAVIVLYTTNKLLVQGNENAIKEIDEMMYEKRVGKKVKQISYLPEHGVIVGSDEALKGDSFGGMVVASVKANDEQRKDLLFAGVTDSKKLKDYEIPIIAERIKKVANYKVISMMPEEYNSYESVTTLLNYMHSQAISSLKPYDKAVIDKYPGCDVAGIKETKAEQKYVEVAAASILAREGALIQLKKISEMVGFNVPKGSTHVSEALMRVKKSKMDFRKVAKIGFRNVQKFM